MTRSRPNAAETWIVIAGLAGLWLALGSRVVEQARAHDFLSIYTGGYMASHGRMASLYDPAAQFAVQRTLAPSVPELVPYTRPPYYALMLAPLGLLPFGAAFAVWMLAQIGILIACLAWARRRFGMTALALGCLSMPAAMGIAHGQDCALFLAALMVSYALTENGKPLAAGAALGLLVIKFQFMPLWALALVLQRRWKMLAGFAAAGAVAAGVALASVGVGGLRAYAALLGNGSLKWLAPTPEFMIGFMGLTANFGIASAVADAALLAAIVALFAAAVWRAPLWRMFAAGTAASLLAAPHAYGYDAAMLLLGLWLALAHAGLRSTKILAVWLCTPVPFAFTLVGKPWAAASSLSLLALLAALAWEGEGLKALSPPARRRAKEGAPEGRP